MKKTIITALLYTVVTAVLLGIVYPMAITGIAHLLFPRQAEGQLIRRDGVVVGSALIGQTFTGEKYFHGRASAAGTGYDAGASSGSNLGPSSKAFAERVGASVRQEGAGAGVPVDLVTASGSGLDPEISPAAAAFQVERVARSRGIGADAVVRLVQNSTRARQFGVLGEPGVNVLNLNLALDAAEAQTR